MKAALKRSHPRNYKSKLEADFAQELELGKKAGIVLDWGYERLKLRLGRGAWYTPDFDALDEDGHLILYEVKGFWREAARVRIKVAANQFWMYQFVAITKNKQGRWEQETIKAA